MLPCTLNLPLLVRESELVKLFSAFGLADEFEKDFAVFVPCDAPVGVVVADDAGEVDLEGRREFEVEDNLSSSLGVADEAFFDIRVKLHLIVETGFVAFDQFLLRKFFFSWENLQGHSPIQLERV